ncbi:MAG: ankyrin repeat domain-containing protein [Alphaproteobacteria bacterium]|nr:ankyrin repeat domain-containing protein [Alphaproteobacteria bacterium]
MPDNTQNNPAKDHATARLLRHVRSGELTEEKLTDCLAQGADINATNNQGKSLLLIAAHNELADTVGLLLKHGADIERNNGPRNETALLAAIDTGSINAIDILLKHGANTEAQSPEGYTPLLRAANRDDDAIVETLLAAGANINATSHKGTTALALSILTTKHDTFNLLLKWDASVNTPDARHATPLMQACAMNDPYKVRTLLDKGANIDLRNNNGENALDITCNVHGSDHPIKHMLDAEITRRTTAAFQKAAEKGTTKTRKIRRPRTSQSTPARRR